MLPGDLGPPVELALGDIAQRRRGLDRSAQFNPALYVRAAALDLLREGANIRSGSGHYSPQRII
jgi:hypothetical protein